MTSLPGSKTHHRFAALKPSLSAGVSSFLLLAVVGCSSIRIPTKSGREAKNLESKSYASMEARDYADHFASLRSAFLETPGIRSQVLDQAATTYLQGLLGEIIARNEIFFRDLRSARVTLIKSDSPLHFSLPRGEIFLSRGLITKYIKHESMLVSILAYELVRSEKLLYPRETVVPTGYMPLERVLGLGRLSLQEKMQVHKWAYHLTVRSGYDGEYYLSWLQVQNRNTADFLLQVGDPNLITREESLFKAFLIKHGQDSAAAKKNSSRNFYTLLNKLRDEA